MRTTPDGPRPLTGSMAGFRFHDLAVRVVPLALACALASACSSPPEAPRLSTDLYLLELRGAGDALSLGPPVNLTRRAGYDNQPCFLPGGEGLLYVSRDENGTDIYEIDPVNRISRRLTHTRLEREYSPQPIPGGDALSVVRVERDGLFRLLRLDPGGANPTPVTDLVHESIGYYAWIDAGTVAVIVVAEDEEYRELLIVDMERGTIHSVTREAGRSVQKVPDRRAVSFVHEQAQADSSIEIFDADTGETRSLGPALPGSADHAWLPDGRLVMGRDGDLYAREARSGTEWERLAALGEAGLREITRITIDPRGGRMVLVAAAQ